MLRKVAIILILIPLLFNGVSATVHINEENHNSSDAPHVHFELVHHAIIDAVSNQIESGDNESQKHFHLYVSVFLKADELRVFEKRDTFNLFGFNSQFISIYPTPPTPPPNIDSLS
ncbi:MAG: hypothetical protein ABJI60_12835 [Kangiellaceae bacterium]|jgi:hypothetical protein